jgi:hypothetical protein
MLDAIRAGLADPFAQQIVLPEAVLTRAEARAVERALSGAARPARARRIRFTFFGVEVFPASSSAAVGRQGDAR